MVKADDHFNTLHYKVYPVHTTMPWLTELLCLWHSYKAKVHVAIFVLTLDLTGLSILLLSYCKVILQPVRTYDVCSEGWANGKILLKGEKSFKEEMNYQGISSFQCWLGYYCYILMNGIVVLVVFKCSLFSLVSSQQ